MNAELAQLFLCHFLNKNVHIISQYAQLAHYSYVFLFFFESKDRVLVVEIFQNTLNQIISLTNKDRTKNPWSKSVLQTSPFPQESPLASNLFAGLSPQSRNRKNGTQNPDHACFLKNYKVCFQKVAKKFSKENILYLHLPTTPQFTNIPTQAHEREQYNTVSDAGLRKNSKQCFVGTPRGRPDRAATLTPSIESCLQGSYKYSISCQTRRKQTELFKFNEFNVIVPFTIWSWDIKAI